MEIENKGQGLNLTLQVVDGVLAHNGEMLHRKYAPHYEKTWADFEKEYRACYEEAGFSRKINPMTLEGCVMRIADIIAYIGRDIEDAIELKLLTRDEIPAQIKQVLGNRNAQIIDTLVADLIVNSYGKPHLLFSEEVFDAFQDLLSFNRENIYFNKKIKSELPKIRTIFCMLFDRYVDDLKTKNPASPLFRYFQPSDTECLYTSTSDKRLVIDFLAGMTDDFLIDQFKSAFLPHSFGYATDVP